MRFCPQWLGRGVAPAMLPTLPAGPRAWAVCFTKQKPAQATLKQHPLSTGPLGPGGRVRLPAGQGVHDPTSGVHCPVQRSLSCSASGQGPDKRLLPQFIQNQQGGVQKPTGLACRKVPGQPGWKMAWQWVTASSFSVPSAQSTGMDPEGRGDSCQGLAHRRRSHMASFPHPHPHP